jgi:hypothetical protein
MGTLEKLTKLVGDFESRIEALEKHLGHHGDYFRSTDIETDNQIFCVFCHNF